MLSADCLEKAFSAADHYYSALHKNFNQT